VQHSCARGMFASCLQSIVSWASFLGDRDMPALEQVRGMSPKTVAPRREIANGRSVGASGTTRPVGGVAIDIVSKRSVHGCKVSCEPISEGQSQSPASRKIDHNIESSLEGKV